MSHAVPSRDTLICEAVEIDNAIERADYLNRACGSNLILRQQVEALVAAHFQAGSFLEQPVETPFENATLAFHVSPEEPGTIIGPYRLLEQIGEGGMGIVFMAEQSQPVRRRVALKVIKAGMDSKHVVARFEAERQALALMDHPNIARVIDAGATESGRPYFAMELVRGLPIPEYCDQAQLSIPDRLKLFILVCRAVQHAHQKGVIHRDIKPSNVMVTMIDGAPVPKVIDFGVAKATGVGLTDRTLFTGFHQLVGTPMYMSPEQADLSGVDVDTRADVYALGVLLYELLTGLTPFDPETMRTAGLDELRRIIREEEPRRPSLRVSTLAAEKASTVADRRQLDVRRLGRLMQNELDWVVMRTLEKDRNRRYESASALAADVERYLNDEPVLARQPTAINRLRKFARRNRARLAAVAVLGVAVLAVAGAAGYSIWERGSRAQAAEQKSSESLAGARAAIEAGDLAQAEQHAAEAAGHLGDYRVRLPDAAAAVDRVRQEIEARRTDADRFRKFQRQVTDSYGDAHLDGVTHEERISTVEAALGLYGVLTATDWTAQLAQSYLTPAEQGQVREAVFIGLVYLADYRVRWLKDDFRRSARESLELLRRAEAFHAPTRAFYFVRSVCHWRLNDATAAAEADKKLFEETPAVTAWDHYLPGHTAGWKGDIDEAIRSYRAALRVQPDHYPSLFFLAHRLAEKKEYPESIGLWTACIALRPHKMLGHTNRAWCYMEMGRHDAAEADYASAYSFAPDVDSQIWVVQELRRFHQEIGREDKGKADQERLVELHKIFVADQRRDLGPNHEKTLIAMNDFAAALIIAGRLPEALTQLEQLQKGRRDNGQKESTAELINLAILLGRMGRHEDAIQLLTPFLRTCESTPNHPDLPVALHELAHAYELANRMSEAVPLFERSLAELKARSDSERTKIFEFSIYLGRAYMQTAQSAKAIALYEPLLEQWKAKEGPEHDQTNILKLNLALSLRDTNRLEVAETINREVLKHAQANSSGSVKHASALVELGLTLLLQRKYADAEPVLRECVAIREKQIPTDWPYFNAVSSLGGALLGQGRTADAEPLLLKGYEGMKQREKEIPGFAKVRLTEALERLVRLYETTGKPDQARAWREKLPTKANGKP